MEHISWLADCLFRKSRDEFMRKTGRTPTDCVMSMWLVEELAAASGLYLKWEEDKTFMYRGIRLTPSLGNEDMFFFIKY